MVAPDAVLFLLLLLWGGAVAVDGTSFGQFMVSRPFIAAAVAGLLAGDVAAGVAAGLVLEAMHLVVLPVGAARYPEGGPAAVVVGALFAMSDGGASTLLASVLFFALWERLGGESVRLIRQLNGRILRPGGVPLGARALERRHRMALALDFGRGMLLVASGLPVLTLLLAAVRGRWALGDETAEVLVACVTAGLIAGTLRLFAGRARLFVAGLIGGVLVLLIGR